MAERKANILVVFYSRDGSVEALAKAVSEGAREAGAEVRLRRCPILFLRQSCLRFQAGRSAAGGCSPSTGPQRRPTQSGPMGSYLVPRRVLVIRRRS